MFTMQTVNVVLKDVETFLAVSVGGGGGPGRWGRWGGWKGWSGPAAAVGWWLPRRCDGGACAAWSSPAW